MKFLLFLSISLCMACSASEQKGEESSVKSDGLVLPCLDCYFFLHDKYTQDYDSMKLERWKEQVVSDVLAGKNMEEFSVFNRKGGGPMGAHWNSDAPLFCVSGDSSIHAIALNDLAMPLSVKQVQSLYSFEIADTVWSKALRNIEPTDFAKLYPNVDTMTITENSPVGEGQLLEISLKSKRDTLCSRAFTIAFGE
ncbi:MAG: hypothetical protein EP332_09610 [Bacteroidetes bacterium]|nr:MAG: hypothetical protein EP332_09610 [Bacteroidota bacterium]